VKHAYTLPFCMSMGILGSIFVADGCTINPFSPPELEPPRASSVARVWVGALGGAGGAGARGAAGGSSGMGGTGGIVEVCMCAADLNGCTDDLMGECPGGKQEACHPVNLGAACPEGYCNPDGVCRDCMACADDACVDRCNGVECTKNTICKSEQCQNGRCCNSDCVGACRVCDWPGKEGTCTRYPNGSHIQGCSCSVICNIAGDCVNQTKAALGALCTASNDCQSGVCRAEYCRSAVDEPCVDDMECTTNLCDPVTKTCKLCTGANPASCPMGSECMMQVGWCKALPGQPAQDQNECIMGTSRYGFLCGRPIGASCTEHLECIYRNCSPDGKCTGPCDAPGNTCFGGTSCNAGGTCLLKAGSYCIQDYECQTNMCTGFPRRCQ